MNQALPDIWGQGILFAFSGWDGATDWFDDFVMVAHQQPFGWYVEYPIRFVFRIRTPSQEYLRLVSAEVITNDHLSLVVQDDQGSSIAIKMAMLDCHTLVGTVIACENEQEIILAVTEVQSPVRVECDIESLIVREQAKAVAAFLERSDVSCEEDGYYLTTRLKQGDSAVFCVGKAIPEGLDSATVQQAFDLRAQFFSALPEPAEQFLARAPAERRKTFLKAASVIKVNLHTAQGGIPCNWSTPDRYPHRKMWLWDSAFHAIGLCHLNPSLAGDQINAVLSQIREDGFIPHYTCPIGEESKITQAPILAWASLAVFLKQREKRFLRSVYPRLQRFLEFFIRERDKNQNGLCEWEFRHASGMDNSPRFDEGSSFDAIDLNCFLARDFDAMGWIAKTLEDEFPGDADVWFERYQQITDRINQLLWDEETGFYYDRAVDGAILPLKTHCGFLPLFAQVAPAERAERLLGHLLDEKEFWTSLPVPSVARDEESYSKDMWRGPTWLNYNYFVIQGLRNYNYNSAAHELTERTLNEVVRWYCQEGVIFEYYDAEAQDSPRQLYRKRKRGGDSWINNVIRDYHWSVSVFLSLALESQEPRKTGNGYQ